jgi:hypothetical protein
MRSLINPREFLTNFREALTLDLVACNEAQVFFKRYALNNFDKKFSLGINSPASRRSAAIEKFREVNDRMIGINNLYQSGLAEHWNRNPTLRRARNFVHEILNDSPDGLMDEMFLRAKHSSGTSLRVKYTDTSIEAKWTWPVTGSKTCVRLWEHYKIWDYELYSSTCNLNEGSIDKVETVITDSSRATTVPKTDKIDRFISVEPTLNMFFQQGILSLMSDRLARYGLLVQEDQEKHRHLAFIASITGGYSTIDFSSMSDSLSLAICHFLLPKMWYSLLLDLRSASTTLPGGVDCPLGMMSTMGNATTFPLETLLLYCLAESAVCSSRGKPVLCRLVQECHVYGDDCIVPSDATPAFLEICSLVGFVTNKEKTFVDGRFRESCGGDFYCGRDVRPFYLKSLPDVPKKKSLEAYLYTTINGVIRMYIKYFGSLAYVYDKTLLRYLFKVLASVTKLVKFVPEDFPEDAGITQLRDSGRLCREYSLQPSPVGVNIHGMLCFSYLRYDFPFKRKVHDGVRYASLLKKVPFRANEEHDKDYKVRRNGFYVERKFRYGGGCNVLLPSYPYWLSYRTIVRGISPNR